jgi:hypothetical protein
VSVGNEKNHDGAIEKGKGGTYRSLLKHSGHPVYMLVLFVAYDAYEDYSEVVTKS